MTLYLSVFLLKLLGSTASNFRLILIKDGSLKLAILTNIIGNLTWVLSVSIVVGNMKEDLFIILPFITAVIIGGYIAMYLDKKINNGNILTTIITSESSNNLKELLSKGNFDYSSFNAKGRDENKEVIMIKSRKKNISNLMEKIKQNEIPSFIINEKIEEVN